MAIWLKQSTASQEIPIGYFLDSTDGDTEETALSITAADIKLWKTGATSLVNKNSGDASHMSNGIYYATLDATDTNTLGPLIIFVHESGALANKIECLVLPANVYDSLVAGTDTLDANVTQWLGTAAATPTTAGVPEVDVTYISGDSTAADNLELMYDGTGYTDETAPSSRSQLDSLSVGTAALHKETESYTPTTGTQTSGTYTDTETINNVYHQITDVAGTIDYYYQFDVGGSGKAVEVTITGYVNGSNDVLGIYAYDWDGAAWDQIGTKQGKNGTTNEVVNANILFKHTGTGANLGKVRIRLYGTGLTTCTSNIDQIIVAYTIVSQSVGYEGGAVWIDTVGGTAGTESFVNGVADNPTNSLANAITIAGNVGLKRYHVSNDSSITFAEAHDSEVWSGEGWSLALGGQDLSQAHIYHCNNVTGTGTSPTGEVHILDSHIGNATLGQAHITRCSLDGTLTLSAASDYVLEHCISGIAGASAPIIDMGAAVGATNLSVRNWHGGLTLNNISGADVITLDGVFGTITLNGTGGTVEIRGIAKAVTDNRGGSPTLNDDSLKADDITAILADTNELQTDWADGGRLDAILDARASQASVDALNDISVNDILTTTMTEAYAADGSQMTLSQAMYMVHSSLSEFSISGTTITCKQLDGTTTAMTYTLDSATNPTSRTRAT